MESGNAIRSNASVRLQYPRIWKTYSVGCLVIIIVLTIYAAWFQTSPDESTHNLNIIIPGLFALLALVLVLETVFTWYGVDEEGISIHGVLHRHRTIRWDEITSIDTEQPYPSQGTNGFVINAYHDQFTLRASFDGLSDFAVFVKRKLPESEWKPAERMLNVYCPTRYSEQMPECYPRNNAETGRANIDNSVPTADSDDTRRKDKPRTANWGLATKIGVAFLLVTLLVSQDQQGPLTFYLSIIGIAVFTAVAVISEHVAKRT